MVTWGGASGGEGRASFHGALGDIDIGTCRVLAFRYGRADAHSVGSRTCERFYRRLTHASVHGDQQLGICGVELLDAREDALIEGAALLAYLCDGHEMYEI